MRRNSNAKFQAAIGLLVIACGEQQTRSCSSNSGAPPPETVSAPRKALPPTKRDEPSERSAPRAPSTALVVAQGALQFLEVTTGRQSLVGTFEVDWCTWDLGNDVAWMISDGILSTISPSGEVRSIAKTNSEGPLEIVYGPRRVGKFAGSTGINPDLRIDLKAKEFIAVDNCTGDGLFSCTEAGASESPDWTSTRNPQFLAEMANLSEGEFLDPEAAERLGPHLEAPPKLKTDHRFTDVGISLVLGSTKYRLTPTSIRVGDFDHYGHHLYDAETQTYFSPESPTQRSRVPVEGPFWEVGDLALSPDERFLMELERIIPLDGKSLPIPIERGCGWVGGGTTN